MKIKITSFLILLTMLYSAQTVGTIKNSVEALNGYTLFSPTPSTEAFLIDNCGKVVNNWNSSYQPGLSTYLLEDGSLLRTCKLSNPIFTQGGSGGRIERYDWSGNLIWEFDFSTSQYCQHHDIEYLPNGNILILAVEKKTVTESINAGRNPNSLPDGELWAEFIVELQPIGNDSAHIVWEWHSWDHLIQNFDSTKNNYQAEIDDPDKFNINYMSNNSTLNKDWMHVNSIDYNLNRDEIILSSKKWSELWVIDHSTNSAQASSDSGGDSGMGGDIIYRWGNGAAYGQNTPRMLDNPHDIHWIDSGKIDEGKIMIFNNGKDRGWSSVDIIDPPVDSAGNYILINKIYGPSNLSWTYEDPIPSNFFARRISGAQRLENGNTLICSGTEGYFFEIDSNKNKVWEYISPITNNGIATQGLALPGPNNVFRAYRFSPDFIGFDNKNLIAGLPIELNADTANCMIFTNIENLDSNSDYFLNIFPNPFNENIKINTNFLGETIEIYDLMGQLCFKTKISAYFTTINLVKLKKGIYILKVGKFKKMPIIKY
jgi:hypothetical protein